MDDHTVAAGLSKAAELRRARDYASALEVLSKLGDGRPDVDYHRGWVYDCAGNDASALVMYRRALLLHRASASGSLGADDHLGVLLGLGAMLLRSGQTGEAIEYFREAVLTYPDADAAFALLTAAYDRSS